jgi:hypothetical protein
VELDFQSYLASRVFGKYLAILATFRQKMAILATFRQKTAILTTFRQKLAIFAKSIVMIVMPKYYDLKSPVFLQGFLGR